MAPITSSPSSNRHFLKNSDPSSSNNPSNGINSTPNHHIPFHSTNHQPSQLGFGFGFGSSFSASASSNSTSQNQNISSSSSSSSSSAPLQWGSTPNHHSTSTSFGQSNPNPNSISQPNPIPILSSSTNDPSSSHSIHTGQWKSATPRKTDSKRRREEDDEESYQGDGDEDMSIAGRSSSGSPVPTNQRYNSQARQLLPKRMRAGLGTGLDDHSRIINSNSLAPGPAAIHSSRNHVGINKPFAGGLSNHSTETATGSNPNAKGKERVVETDTSGVDLGKMLASLDKPALLSLLHSLLSTSTDPKLPSQIISLLPAPSLESVDSALDEAERAVRQSLPWGTGSRDEYIWSRVRNSLFEFVNISLSYAPFFMPKPDETNGSNGDASGAKRNENIHPASTFAFLQSLTVRLLRIENGLPCVPRSVFNFKSINPHPQKVSRNGKEGDQNSMQESGEMNFKRILISFLPSSEGELLLSPTSPDTLLSNLAPTLLVHWDNLITRLSDQVNQQGRMFGKDVVLSWGRSLVALGMSGAANHATSHGSNGSSVGLKPEERAIRLAMDGIREKFESQLGWLVANPSSYSNSTAQWDLTRRNSKRERDSNSVTMEEEEEL